MMRRLLAVLTILAAIPNAVSADPIKLHNNRLFLQVRINGVAAEALLDTAAEMTFVDTRLAAELKLNPEGSETAKGSGGPTQVRFAKGVDIEAAGVKLDDMTVALLDMTDLSKRLVDTELRIILGREFFDAARVEVDILGGTIRKLDRSTEPAGLKLPLKSQRGIESFPCKVEGIATECDIDLGNGSDVLIGRKFAETNGLLQPGRVVEKKAGGGIGGGVTRDIIVMSSIEVGGRTFDKVRGAIDPQPTAGEVNVGTSLLRNFLLTIDFANHAVWFKPR